MPPAERLRVFRRLADEGRAIVRAWVAPYRAGLVQLSPEARAAWALGLVWDVAEYQPDPPGEWDTASPVGHSTWPHPGRPLSPVTGREKGAGDCEDLAILLVAVLQELDVVSRMDWLEQPDAEENHVSVEVRAPRGWLWADPSVEGAFVGEHPYAAARRMGFIHRAELGASRA